MHEVLRHGGNRCSTINLKGGDSKVFTFQVCAVVYSIIARSINYKLGNNGLMHVTISILRTFANELTTVFVTITIDHVSHLCQ